MRTSLNWFFIFTAAVSLALPAIGHFAVAQNPNGPPQPSGYTCTQPNQANCWHPTSVPCQNATCVNWVNEYGTLPPLCTPVTYCYLFDCSVTAQAWQGCADMNFNPPPQGQCTLAWSRCGVYTLYVLNCDDDNACIVQSMGYCFGSAPDRCP